MEGSGESVPQNVTLPSVHLHVRNSFVRMGPSQGAPESPREGSSSFVSRARGRLRVFLGPIVSCLCHGGFHRELVKSALDIADDLRTNHAPDVALEHVVIDLHDGDQVSTLLLELRGLFPSPVPRDEDDAPTLRTVRFDERPREEPVLKALPRAPGNRDRLLDPSAKFSGDAFHHPSRNALVHDDDTPSAAIPIAWHRTSSKALVS